jgi:hypothetical protein
VERRAGEQVWNHWQVGVPGLFGQNTTTTPTAPQAPVTTSAVIAAARDAAHGSSLTGVSSATLGPCMGLIGHAQPVLDAPPVEP